MAEPILTHNGSYDEVSR